MISNEDIEKEKKTQCCLYNNCSVKTFHEHNDCVRIAYQWLDAQKKTNSPIPRRWPIKHMIESWAGRYVSMCDVCIASRLHPDIKGKYPRINISQKITIPCSTRLDNIPEANTQLNYKSNSYGYIYKKHERVKSEND